MSKSFKFIAYAVLIAFTCENTESHEWMMNKRHIHQKSSSCKNNIVMFENTSQYHASVLLHRNYHETNFVEVRITP